jgi:hypothetical protein
MRTHFQAEVGGAPNMDTANFEPDVPYIIGTCVDLSAALGFAPRWQSKSENLKSKMTANFGSDGPYIIEAHAGLSAAGLRPLTAF